MYLVVDRVVLNDELTIELTLGVGGVEDMHSVPKAFIGGNLSGRESAELSMGIGKDRLKAS